jgi:hypothetical protein
MEAIAPGVHPVDLFAGEYDIRSAWFGVLELCALVYSGTVRVAAWAVLGVQLYPMATIATELLGGSVSLVPLIRTTKCTYRVAVVQRRLIGIGVHFWLSPRVPPEGSGIPGWALLHVVPQGVYGVCARRRPAPCWHAAALFFRPASLAGWPRPRSSPKRARSCSYSSRQRLS